MSPAVRMTVEDFLASDVGIDPRCELVDGIPECHSEDAGLRYTRILMNVDDSLRARALSADSRRPTGAGLKTSPCSFRRPDFAISLDPRDSGRWQLAHPRVIIEIAGPVALGYGKTFKIIEYQQMLSVDTVVLIHTNDVITTFERISERVWSNKNLPVGADLAIRDPAMVIPAGEIFAEDNPRFLMLKRDKGSDIDDELWALATRVIGTREHANLWFRESFRSLGGQQPIELLQTPGGRGIVENYLMKIEAGVYI